MMDCAQYKRAILADPQHPTAEMRLHAAECHACARYTENLLRFETRLERALRVPIDAAAEPQVIPLRPRPAPLRRGWLALAASVLVAAFVAGGLWLALPRPGLAADVVGHVAAEPQAWSQPEVPVSKSQLDAVLRDSRLRLKSSAGLVSYASSCPFRGHHVPHLVVQTGSGPVTVMVLTHESVSGVVHFDEQGYHGMIVPVPGHGSLAVLARGANADLEPVQEVAAKVVDALDWN